MKSWTRWTGVSCALVAGIGSVAGGCGSDSPSTSSSGSTASGAGGGTTTSASGTGGEATTTTSGTTSSTASGTGGGSAGSPFTSHGDASYEAQTSIAASDLGSVVAAWIGFFSDNTSAIGYAISRDAGVTWTSPRYLKSPGGRLAGSPVVAVDKKDRFTLAWLGFTYNLNAPDEHIYVSRLEPKADKFADPVVASDDGSSTQRDFDKPSILIDADDAVLLSYADFSGSGMGTPATLAFTKSLTDTSFLQSAFAGDASFGNLGNLCRDPAMGAAGRIYLPHLGANGTLRLHSSITGGGSWDLGSPPATNVVFQDVTCATKGADLWITYASGTAPFVSGQNTPADAVNVIHSGDSGKTFDAAVKVSSGPAGAQYLFPRIARSSSGALEIVYYQGTAGNPATLMRASSTTGATWTSAKLADAGTFTLDRSLANWLGDYLGAAATSKGFFCSYTENAQGKAHIGFATVALP
jgi:hypothetical protein